MAVAAFWGLGFGASLKRKACGSFSAIFTPGVWLAHLPGALWTGLERGICHGSKAHDFPWVTCYESWMVCGVVLLCIVGSFFAFLLLMRRPDIASIHYRHKTPERVGSMGREKS